MTARSVTVGVPASSANLGPGYDVLAAALDLYLTLEVTEADTFSIDPGDEEARSDRTNYCVAGFATLCPVDRFAFRVRLGMRIGRGLGASAAAIVAGLMAAAEVTGTPLSPFEVYERAATIEQHPDNVAASTYGGVVVCARSPSGDLMEPARLAVPTGIVPVLVVPNERLKTTVARAAIPATVTMGDVVHNLAATCQLVAGLERSDSELIARGLADQLHQPRRADLYPKSMELVARAEELGALGGTISGAGPTTLLWCERRRAHDVATAARSACVAWAEVQIASFSSHGARVLDPWKVRTADR